MYLNTVFKYNVFKYCPALQVGKIDNYILKKKHFACLRQD